MSAQANPIARASQKPRGLQRRQVSEIQRARILSAAVDTIEATGYAETTVAAVIERARISRKTFYEVFASRDECFAAIVEEIFARAHAVASAAYAAEGNWLAGIRSALKSLLYLIDEEPTLARIWFVDAMTGPNQVHAYRVRADAMLAAAVDVARGMVPGKSEPSPLTAEATVGGISQIIYTRLVGGSQEPFVQLLRPCMYLIVLPYLGAAPAAAELRRKPSARKPRQKAPDAKLRRELLHGMNLRVTYRTLRALNAICEQPGANNRTVAEEAGIKDQGQVSKLLARLEWLDLIENRGLRRKRYGANAWHITARGSELVRATRVDELAGRDARWSFQRMRVPEMLSGHDR
jgi:AcrR family transcriptional regulator